MPFELTSDEELIRRTVAEFASMELTDKATEEIDQERRFPKDALQKMAQLGLYGMLVPPDLGGPGTNAVAFTLALEEVARKSGVTATLLNNVNACGSLPLAVHGNDEQRAQWLAPILTGESLPAWALTEPGAGSDITALDTRAVKDADGNYKLTGLKSFVMAGGIADVYIVLARALDAHGKPLGDNGGLTAFIVPKDAPGLQHGPPERMMSLRGSHASELFLKDVPVPSAQRLGNEGDGLKVAMTALEASKLGYAAISVGLMAESLDQARQYSGEREQFRMPIKRFQGIQWKIADMDAQVKAARLMTWYAAAKRDKGEDASVDASAAKLFAAEAAKKVTQESLRIHGGNGFMRDLPLERINRDARAMAIIGGTSEMQRQYMATKLLDL